MKSEAKLQSEAQAKFHTVMQEFQRGELKTRGKPVEKRSQAIAIAYSEAKKVFPSYGNPITLDKVREVIDWLQENKGLENDNDRYAKIQNKFPDEDIKSLRKVASIYWGAPKDEKPESEEIWEKVEKDYHPAMSEEPVSERPPFEGSELEKFLNNRGFFYKGVSYLSNEFSTDMGSPPTWVYIYENRGLKVDIEVSSDDTIESIGDGIWESLSEKQRQEIIKNIIDFYERGVKLGEGKGPTIRKLHLNYRGYVPSDMDIGLDVIDAYESGAVTPADILTAYQLRVEEEIRNIGKEDNPGHKKEEILEKYEFTDKEIIIDALTTYMGAERDLVFREMISDVLKKIEEGEHIAINDKGECVYQEQEKKTEQLPSSARNLASLAESKLQGKEIFDHLLERSGIIQNIYYYESSDLDTPTMYAISFRKGVLDKYEDMLIPMEEDILKDIIKYGAAGHIQIIDYSGTEYEETAMENFEFEEKQEERVGNIKYNKDKKVGDTIDIRRDSSSPPAVWTDTYTITRIDEDGNIYGIYKDRPEFREFEGYEME